MTHVYWNRKQWKWEANLSHHKIKCETNTHTHGHGEITLGMHFIVAINNAIINLFTIINIKIHASPSPGTVPIFHVWLIQCVYSAVLFASFYGFIMQSYINIVCVIVYNVLWMHLRIWQRMEPKFRVTKLFYKRVCLPSIDLG